MTLNFSKLLNSFPGIIQFSTTRDGGVSEEKYATFNTSPYSGDNPKNQQQNIDLLIQKLNINTNQLIFPFQNHGTEIRIIDPSFFELTDEQKSGFLNGVDALITRQSSICLGITTADCVPITFYDPINKVIAVAHAGWRGTVAGIAKKVLLSMQHNFKSNISDIYICIGPSISSKVYNVGIEVFHQFSEAKFPTESIFEQHGNTHFLDLWESNKWLMIENGINPEYIEVANECTFTLSDKYFSARKLGIQSGRMMNGIMLKG